MVKTIMEAAVLAWAQPFLIRMLMRIKIKRCDHRCIRRWYQRSCSVPASSSPPRAHAVSQGPLPLSAMRLPLVLGLRPEPVLSTIPKTPTIPPSSPSPSRH